MFSGKLLWITGGIGAAAIICCVALGIALRNQSKTIDRLEADIQALLHNHPVFRGPD